MIQYAHEHQLSRVAVVYTDTKWAGEGWPERVDKMERWAGTYGFTTFRTSSKGFRQLARDKSGFPSQKFQWCSYILKIEPGMRWLATFDPSKHATCLVGVRREESPDRINFPEWLDVSENHGGRPMSAPFATWTAKQRNDLLFRAGIEVLPHRSRECLCVNANRSDMRRYTKTDIARVEAIESEIGKPMYRPYRHMGATGIREVVKWANSRKGKYELPREESMSGCDTGFCGS